MASKMLQWKPDGPQGCYTGGLKESEKKCCYWKLEKRGCLLYSKSSPSVTWKLGTIHNELDVQAKKISRQSV